MEGFSYGFRFHLENCQKRGTACCGSRCDAVAGVTAFASEVRAGGDTNSSCDVVGAPLAASAPGTAFLALHLIEKKNTGLPRAVTYCCHFPSLSRLCSHVAAQFPKTCSCSLTWNSGIFISASTKWLHNHSVGFTHPLISVKCHCSCSGVVIRVWLFLAGQGVLQESCFSLASPVRTHGFCVCLLCLCFHHSFWAVNGSKDCQFFEFRHKFASASRSCLPGSQWGMCYVRTGETAQYWTPTSKWRERQKPVWKILLCKLPLRPPRFYLLQIYQSTTPYAAALRGARSCGEPVCALTPPKKLTAPSSKSWQAHGTRTRELIQTRWVLTPRAHVSSKTFPARWSPPAKNPEPRNRLPWSHQSSLNILKEWPFL